MSYERNLPVELIAQDNMLLSMAYSTRDRAKAFADKIELNAGIDPLAADIHIQKAVYSLLKLFFPYIGDLSHVLKAFGKK